MSGNPWSYNKAAFLCLQGKSVTSFQRQKITLKRITRRGHLAEKMSIFKKLQPGLQCTATTVTAATNTKSTNESQRDSAKQERSVNNQKKLNFELRFY